MCYVIKGSLNTLFLNGFQDVSISIIDARDVEQLPIFGIHTRM